MSGAPQITLRAMAADDRDRLLAWRNAPEVAPYMYTDHLITAEEHDRWLAGALRDPRRSYWIVAMDAKPVGLANLYDIDVGNRRCAWAYYLAEPDVRGRGVGSFVEYSMIERVFGMPHLDKLWCEVLAGNEAVWKLHETFGFQVEARFRHHVYKAGLPLDVIGLGLLRDDWRPVRAVQRQRLIGKGFTLPD